MFAQLVTINGKIYVDLQRKSYYEDKNNPHLKRILLQIEAWTRLVRQAVPTIDNAIKEQQTKEPTSKSRKYCNGMYAHTLLIPEMIFQTLIRHHS